MSNYQVSSPAAPEMGRISPELADQLRSLQQHVADTRRGIVLSGLNALAYPADDSFAPKEADLIAVTCKQLLALLDALHDHNPI